MIATKWYPALRDVLNLFHNMDLKSFWEDSHNP